jgi:hypothetical protein
MEHAVDPASVVQYPHAWLRTITNNALRFEEKAATSDYREMKNWGAEWIRRDARPRWPRVKSLLSIICICG